MTSWSYACKPYEKSLLLTYVYSPFKGDLSRVIHISSNQRHCLSCVSVDLSKATSRSYACKPYQKALLLTYIYSPFNGNLSRVIHINPNQRHCLSYTSCSPLKGYYSRIIYVSPNQRHCLHIHHAALLKAIIPKLYM